MKAVNQDERILTGVRNLDEVLSGGLPVGNITVLAGTPGSGKTILAQQIAFKNASPENSVIFFQTLSEPTAKTLRYLKQFSFYNPKKLEDGSIEFIDLGEILRTDGIGDALSLLMGHVKRLKPAFVIIDSFKVFADLASSREELRKFSYEIAINLMGWECTTLLLGEFNVHDLQTNPLFSIVDGIISLKHHSESGEEQRFIQVIKMRGTNHSRDEHTFLISSNGLEVYAPRVTIRRLPLMDKNENLGPSRMKVGISTLDDMLGVGIPLGSSILVTGAAGTGKTLLLLEFIYKGATKFKEKGIFFSFEETTERLITNARSMGWDMESEINKGNIEIVFISQTDIQVEKHLLMMKEKIESLGAKRIAIDSASIFVHKVSDPQIVREKIFQLGTIIQNSQGVGMFATDIPYGSNNISRFGVEETVVDGIIFLTSDQKGLKRERYIEIYKLRNTSHVDGKHKIQIKRGGIKIFNEKKKISTQKPKKKK
jgi:circadian clock protein KaiC